MSYKQHDDSSFDRETYDTCLKNLANNKTPGPDKIPDII